ncbi:hypothetical protein [uncultured Campylobacter sp.]|uniref:hypothetical protein n=1 Tax=uncultured Campylobacter sp. TaxID=218934 RepID=UPI0026098469|nr:hypothetical protein [uncultured Campylobacter sp.]
MIKIPRNLSSSAGKPKQVVKKSRTTPQSNAYKDEAGELNFKDFLNSSKFNATCLAHAESKKFSGKSKKFLSDKSDALNHNASKSCAAKSAQNGGANRNLTARIFCDTGFAQKNFFCAKRSDEKSALLQDTTASKRGIAAREKRQKADLRRDNELIDDEILNAEVFNKQFFSGKIFGFDANGREIVPEALRDYNAASRARAMLALYNFNVNADYRIPPTNLKGASQFRAAFLNFIASELGYGACKIYRFKPAVKFCVADNAIIFSYLRGISLPVFAAKPAYKLTRAIVSLRSGLLLNGDDAFRNFVFCKIALRNAGAQLQLVGKSGELIVVRKSGFSLGVVTSFKKILPQNTAIYDNDIKKALELCHGANLDAVYLVYPKNENFNRHVEIKSECFKGNFIMKLVPYKLTDKIY